MVGRTGDASPVSPAVVTPLGRTNVTDRRQTDGRAIAYSEREREFTFAKN